MIQDDALINNSDDHDEEEDDRLLMEYVSGLGAADSLNSLIPMLAREDDSNDFCSPPDGDDNAQQQLRLVLNEKEKDLRLAARIGKCLLSRNEQLQRVNDSLEQQIGDIGDQLTQLRFELQQKVDLLKKWQLHESLTNLTGGAESSSSPALEKSEGRLHSLNVLERKFVILEQENSSLKLEVNHLKYLAECLHEKESRLTNDFAKQTNVLNAQLKELSEKLAQNQDLLAAKDDQLDQKRKELSEKILLNKQLAVENGELTLSLLAAQETQRELAQELTDLEDRYAEVSAMLTESRLELKMTSSSDDDCPANVFDWRKGSALGLYFSPYGQSEDETNTTVQTDQGYDSFRSRSSKECNTSRTSLKCRNNSASKLKLLLNNDQPQKISRPFNDDLLIVTEHLILKSRRPSVELDDAGTILSGTPGIPGSRDLDNALKRLSLRKRAEQEFQKYRQEKEASLKGGDSSSILSLRHVVNDLLTSCPNEQHREKSAVKLLLVKSVQGSEMLSHWKELSSLNRVPDLTSSVSTPVKSCPDSGINSDVESATTPRLPPKHDPIIGLTTLTYVTSQFCTSLYTEAQITTIQQIVTPGIYTRWSSKMMTAVHQCNSSPICSLGLLEIVDDNKEKIQPPSVDKGLFELLDEKPGTKGVISKTTVF